jgi:hypothetical protein
LSRATIPYRISLDLLTAGPDDAPRRLTFRKVATKSGLMDGYCLSFDVQFDSEMRWLGLSEQGSRLAKWSLCRGYAAASCGSGLK